MARLWLKWVGHLNPIEQTKASQVADYTEKPSEMERKEHRVSPKFAWGRPAVLASASVGLCRECDGCSVFFLSDAEFCTAASWIVH